MKKLLAGLTAALIAFSVSAPAFAATTVDQNESNSMTVSTYLSKQDKTITLKSEDDTSETDQITIYEVPVGAVVSLSNADSMLIYFSAKEESANVYSLGDDMGVVSTSYTIPDSLAGKTLFFVGTTGDESESEPLEFVCHVTQSQSTAATYRSDTGTPLIVGQGSSYQFKITSLNGKAPTFAVGGNGFKYALVRHVDNDYFYRITAVGSVGTCCGVYVNGGRIPGCTATIRNVVKSDTGRSLTVKVGKTYQFKITTNCGKPQFVCGTASTFTVKYNGQKGNDYFYIVKAVGKKGQAAGFYVAGEKAPSTIGTIA